MRLHLFNPENDLALAANAVSYTPRRAAQMMSRSGAALPLWYGDGGDRVICRVNNAWYEAMRRDYGLTTDVWDRDLQRTLAPSPWGWSTAARRRFLDEGVPADWLPDDEQLARLRDLSHRHTGAALARYVRESIGDDRLTPEAVEVSDARNLEAVMASVGDQAYVKQPWSSSGRGVISTHAGRPKAMRFALESIAKQGSVIVEPAHDRLLDFALIYECRAGECRFDSTSVFVNDEHGSYTGNLLASEAVRRQKVTDVCDATLLEVTQQALRQGIETLIAPHYDGILGVDMLVTRDGSIDPVVEVNLRRTMGWVANRVSDRFLSPDALGAFEVSKAQKREPAAYHAAANRLLDGTLYLTPPGSDFDFKVTVP